jgi:transposase
MKLEYTEHAELKLKERRISKSKCKCKKKRIKELVLISAVSHCFGCSPRLSRTECVNDLICEIN